MDYSHDRTALGVSSTLLGIGAIWYLVAEAVAAYAFPDYSYSFDFISDLGIPEVGVFEGRHIESKLAIVMNAGFLGQAMMMALAGTLLFWSLPPLRNRGPFASLAVLHAFGIALVGLVHGSPVYDAAGLMVFHGIGAMFAVLGGNALVILAGTSTLRPVLGRSGGRLSVVLGCIGFVSVIVHVVTKGAGIVSGLGVSERLAVYTIVAWQLLFALQVSRVGRTVEWNGRSRRWRFVSPSAAARSFRR